MALTYESVFTEDEIRAILEQEDVAIAKQQLDDKSSGSVYFTLPLPISIKTKLRESLGLDLFSVNSIPMRWIKGDTKPHIDRGSHHFDKTYLVYLTDSPGVFCLGEDSYPIAKGSAYVFSEGLRHETQETGIEPRLLLGPMSEQGVAVGAATTISADGQTQTISFVYESGSGLFYKINSGDLQTVSLPITIENTNTSYALKVLFETDITIDSDILYLICGSSNIQFGSPSLKSDGTRPVLTVDSVSGYPGFIRNGTSSSDGNADISIYNLTISNSGSTLANGAGWIAQEYFGKSAINNFIINCTSSGDIPLNGGGIVGQYAAYKGTASSSLTILGCSSTGDIGTSAGGIAGKFAGTNGTPANVNVSIQQCFSEGAIGQSAGGIVGESAGNVTCTKCYSTGAIGNAAGGIFGRFGGAGADNEALADKCYSTGSIGVGAGGIFGRESGTTTGLATATNCYTTGSIDSTATTGRAGGIFGREYANQTVTNCYVSGTAAAPRGYILADSTDQPSTTYSEAKNGGTGWSDTNANSVLQGFPVSGVGATWAATGINSAYELATFGPTPYQRQTISGTSLVQTYSQTVAPGSSSVEALNPDASGNSFTILKRTGGDAGSYSKITINAQTGQISTAFDTVVGIYTLTVRSIGSYFITSFTLTVEAAPSSAEGVSCCSRPLVVKNVDYTTLNRMVAGNILIGSTAVPRQPISYSDIINKKMAYAAKR